MDDSDPTVLALLALAALAAGFVDAVVGGGGLIQLPALLLGLPGASPVQVLATNKLASICGTTASSITYYRRVRPDPRTFLPMMVLAFAGACCGALVASQVPRSAFEPIVLVALVLVGAYVLFKPSLGEVTALRHTGRRPPGHRAGRRVRHRLLRRRARPRHRQLLRVLAGRAARLLVPRGLRQGPAGQLGHQPRRARASSSRRARCSGRSACSWASASVLGAYVGARMAVSRGRRLRAHLLHRRRLGVHRAPRRGSARRLVTRPTSRSPGDAEAETEVRRSRFVCTAVRVETEDAARAVVERARRAHPDAGHHCSAFVLGPPPSPLERSSDDGEPSGTAGAPMLEVVRGRGVSDVAVVVSRWFGGTLLGTGGLARAYADAVRAGLDAAGTRARLLLRRAPARARPRGRGRRRDGPPLPRRRRPRHDLRRAGGPAGSACRPRRRRRWSPSWPA